MVGSATGTSYLRNSVFWRPLNTVSTSIKSTLFVPTTWYSSTPRNGAANVEARNSPRAAAECARCAVHCPPLVMRSRSQRYAIQQRAAVAASCL